MNSMKPLLVGILFFLTACETFQMPAPALPVTSTSLKDLGPAPELTNDIWLNVESPLRLADLRGRVVALAMWTFGCINCQHVMPSLKEWHAAYADDGLVIIGNHYPEFSF